MAGSASSRADQLARIPDSIDRDRYQQLVRETLGFEDLTDVVELVYGARSVTVVLYARNDKGEHYAEGDEIATHRISVPVVDARPRAILLARSDVDAHAVQDASVDPRLKGAYVVTTLAPDRARGRTTDTLYVTSAARAVTSYPAARERVLPCLLPLGRSQVIELDG